MSEYPMMLPPNDNIDRTPELRLGRPGRQRHVIHTPSVFDASNAS